MFRDGLKAPCILQLRREARHLRVQRAHGLLPQPLRRVQPFLGAGGERLALHEGEGERADLAARTRELARPKGKEQGARRLLLPRAVGQQRVGRRARACHHGQCVERARQLNCEQGGRRPAEIEGTGAKLGDWHAAERETTMHGQVHARRRVRRHRDVEKERRVRLEKQAVERRVERRRALLAQVLLH